MHRLIVLVAVVLAGAVAGSASADLLRGDPRQCSYNKPAQCARTAATYTLVAYMRAHGQPHWSNPTTCTATAGLLKWRCDFGSGTARVWFRALSTGWQRVVTVNR